MRQRARLVPISHKGCALGHTRFPEIPPVCLCLERGSAHPHRAQGRKGRTWDPAQSPLHSAPCSAFRSGRDGASAALVRTEPAAAQPLERGVSWGETAKRTRTRRYAVTKSPILGAAAKEAITGGEKAADLAAKRFRPLSFSSEARRRSVAVRLRGSLQIERWTISCRRGR